MEEIFGDNLFAIYIIACIAVISYTNFKDNQRLFLLYLFTYATAFFSVFRVSVSLGLLVLITFVFLEYLSEDSKKLELVTRLEYKIGDYLFMMFFQYAFLWILAAFALLFVSCIVELGVLCSYAVKICSLILLFYGSHQAISQPFKVKSITDICRPFEQYPPYQFEYKTEMQEKFDLLCAFEDKTYFQRENSYSSVSLEYVACVLKNRGVGRHSFFRTVSSDLGAITKQRHILSRLLSRGHSTPEMQLLRTIGIARGYDKYKYQRKIFEVVYSRIFFDSLKQYHKANTYLPLDHYRHYLLYIYFQSVMTKINGYRRIPFSSVFEDPADICHWSMDGLFVACLGLSFRKATDFNLTLYEDIINAFCLDKEHIKELSKQFPTPLPVKRSKDTLFS